MHAAVEQDARQRDRDDALDGLLRRCVQRRDIFTAIAAPTRTSAGDGILIHWVRWLDSTATRPTAPVSSTSKAKV